MGVLSEACLWDFVLSSEVQAEYLGSTLLKFRPTLLLSVILVPIYYGLSSFKPFATTTSDGWPNPSVTFELDNPLLISS